ncbi:MAG: hypothetical protein WC030_00180 [Candidatus Paceibacterota bacterium]
MNRERIPHTQPEAASASREANIEATRAVLDRLQAKVVARDALAAEEKRRQKLRRLATQAASERDPFYVETEDGEVVAPDTGVKLKIASDFEMTHPETSRRKNP